MAGQKTNDPAHKDQVFAILRREILAARLKVTLDEQLNRETSSIVKRLANMKLPPLNRHPQPDSDGQIDDGKKVFPSPRKRQVLDTLRREVAAARLKVALDGQLNRETSPTVKALSGMSLAPITRRRSDVSEPR